MALVIAPVDGVTETEAKERARIAEVASAAVLTTRAPGSTASLSIADANPSRLAGSFVPGERVRVVLDASTRSCGLTTGRADVSLDIERLAVREAKKSLSNLIEQKQKGT